MVAVQTKGSDADRSLRVACVHGSDHSNRAGNVVVSRELCSMQR